MGKYLNGSSLARMLVSSTCVTLNGEAYGQALAGSANTRLGLRISVCIFVILGHKKPTIVFNGDLTRFL